MSQASILESLNRTSPLHAVGYLCTRQALQTAGIAGKFGDVLLAEVKTGRSTVARLFNEGATTRPLCVVRAGSLCFKVGQLPIVLTAPALAHDVAVAFCLASVSSGR